MITNYRYRLPVAQKIKDAYEKKGLSQADIAKHLKCEIETIELIEGNEEVYSKEQVIELKNYLEIDEIILNREEKDRYHSNLEGWRDFINKGRLDDAIRIHDELNALHEINYLPFDADLVMLYDMFNVKFLMAKKEYEAAEKILKNAESEIKNAYPEIKYHYYYNMGSLYIFRKEYEKALKSYVAAYDIGFDDKNHYKHSIHYNLGLCYFHLGMYSHAIHCYEETERLYKSINFLEYGDLFLLYIDINLALSYLIMGKPKLAKKKIAACSPRIKAIRNKDLNKKAVSILGRICIAEKEYDRALDYFETANNFVEEGGVSHLEILYYKIFCLIMMNNPQAESEITYAKSIAQKNDWYLMLFTSLSHLLTLDNDSSVDYIENTTIPKLMKEYRYHSALEYYEVLENHFTINGNELKALKYKALSGDLYKKMAQGGEAHEKEISWPSFGYRYGSER